MSSEINFTWGEQPSSLDISISAEHPLPTDWQDIPFDDEVSSTTLCALIHHMTNVMSVVECNQWIRAVDRLGFETHDVMTAIGEKALADSVHPVIWPQAGTVRTNERRIWQVPVEVNERLFERLRPHLPLLAHDNWKLRGLNRRWRFFRTSSGEDFKSHVDAACARQTPDGRYERSFFSIVLWLNDDFEGGELRLEDDSHRDVKPVAGGCIMFPQDGHPLACRHQGLPVTSGVKYILRTDVMYSPPQCMQA